MTEIATINLAVPPPPLRCLLVPVVQFQSLNEKTKIFSLCIRDGHEFVNYEPSL